MCMSPNSVYTFQAETSGTPVLPDRDVYDEKGKFFQTSSVFLFSFFFFKFHTDCLAPATAATLSSPPSICPSILLYSSISSIRSSPSREASGVTWTALTVPAMGELTTVSIFMADRTHSGWPFSTWGQRRVHEEDASDIEGLDKEPWATPV